MIPRLGIRCLIHNAHLGKNQSFGKILDLKIKHKENFDLIFLFNICHCNLGLAIQK
jgi:hypothetical protein